MLNCHVVAAYPLLFVPAIHRHHRGPGSLSGSQGSSCPTQQRAGLSRFCSASSDVRGAVRLVIGVAGFRHLSGRLPGSLRLVAGAGTGVDRCADHVADDRVMGAGGDTPWSVWWRLALVLLDWPMVEPSLSLAREKFLLMPSTWRRRQSRWRAWWVRRPLSDVVDPSRCSV